MEGSLLRVFFFLVASRGGSGQLLGDLCYLPLKGPESHLVAYYCPGFQDHADARFCCGTCSEPFCCSSQKYSLDPTRCPDFDPVPEVTSPTTSLLEGNNRLNVLWCFIAIFLGALLVWSLCRSLRVWKCSRDCGNHEEEEEEEEEEEIEMEERRSPAPPPPILLPPPSPPRYIDNPPPYSAVDPLASLPVSVTNAPLRMGPTEGASRAHLPGVEEGVPARLRGAEGGSPPRLRGAEGGVQLRGAEGGSPPRLRGAEGGIPPGFREAEWGDPSPPYPDDPPPYSDIHLFASVNLLPPVPSAPRRKRRAKAPRSVRRAPAEPAGTEGGAPAEASGAAAGGGVPAELSGAEGGTPAEASGAAGGGVSAELSGAEGGAFVM